MRKEELNKGATVDPQFTCDFLGQSILACVKDISPETGVRRTLKRAPTAGLDYTYKLSAIRIKASQECLARPSYCAKCIFVLIQVYYSTTGLRLPQL